MIQEAKKLPYPEHDEESIFLSYFTVRRRYKKNKNSKWQHEEITLKESFVHKGVSPEVVIRRRGMLDRIRKKTEWKKGIIEIVKIDFQVYTAQGCIEELIDISSDNK